MIKKLSLLLSLAAGLSFGQVMLFNQIAGQSQFLTSNTAADTATLTISQVTSSIIVGTPTNDATYTTPSATAWCAAVPWLSNAGQNNFWYLMFVKNTAAMAKTITMAGGSGVSVSGTATVAQNAIHGFVVVMKCTGTPAITLVSTGTGAF